nr:MAG TPA: hypothetical protein [Caudoviricetes sp.]
MFINVYKRLKRGKLNSVLPHFSNFPIKNILAASKLPACLSLAY